MSNPSNPVRKDTTGGERKSCPRVHCSCNVWTTRPMLEISAIFLLNLVKYSKSSISNLFTNDYFTWYTKYRKLSFEIYIFIFCTDSAVFFGLVFSASSCHQN